MTLLQIKKPTFLIILAFLVIILLSFYVQVQAENTEKRDKAEALWEQGREAFRAGESSYHYMPKRGQLTRNEKDFQTALEKFNNSLSLYRELGDQQSEADLLTWMARVNVEIGKNIEAMKYLMESLDIYDVLHTHPGEKASVKDADKAMEVVLLYVEGLDHRHDGDYKSALDKFEAMLKLLRKTSETIYDELEILALIGSIKIGLSNFSDGEHYINKLLNAYRKLGKKGHEAILFYNLSSQYNLRGAHAKSLEHIDRALTIFEQFNDKIGMKMGLTKKASIYHEINDYSKALINYEKALAISGDMIDKREDAFILIEVADLYYGMGDYREALQNYEKALQYFKESNDMPNLGRVLVGIGKVNSNLGNYLEAIDNLKEALKTLEGSKDGSSAAHKMDAFDALANVYALLGDEEKAKDLRNVDVKDSYKAKLPIMAQLKLLEDQGFDYEREGKYEEALESFYQALNLTKEMGYKTLENGCLTYVALTYRMLGDYPKALDFYRQSLELSRKYNYKAEELAALIKIAEIHYFHLLDYQKTLDYSKKALVIAEEIWDRPNEEVCLTAMGAIYMDNHEYEKATEYYEKALRVSKEMGSPEKIWGAQYLLGVLAAKYTRQIQKAKSYLREAINTIESIRGTISTEKYKIGFVEDKIQVYTLMIEVLFYLKEYEEAFNYVERAKSRSLLDLLGNRSKLNSGKDKELSQEERILQEKINILLKKIHEGKSQPKKKQRTVLNSWDKELKKTRKEYSDLLAKIKWNNPELYSIVNVNPLTLKEVQNLLEPDTTLLEYFIHPEGVIVWIMDNSKYKSIFTPFLSTELTSKITTFREKIANLQPDYEKEAKELYSFLIKPAKQYIKTKKICIVPHSVLHYLPFQALMNDPEFGGPEFGGIGVAVNFINGSLTVNSVIEGTPAYKAGLKPGDKIMAIDEVSTFNMSFVEVVSRLRGKPSSTVMLIIENEESGTSRTVKLKRESMVQLSFKSKVPDNTDNIKNKSENKTQFLIEEYDIFYAPSASVLKFVLEKRKKDSGKVLAFGNPELEDKDLNLPYAEEEVESIKESYPDTSIYMYENATEDKVKQLSGNYDIIHFASHGELNPQSPLFSCIKMAKEKNEDGRLEVHEIFNLDLENASLVTLSACETGLGKLSSGDELIGLTRGFIYAGTPSIVASLWSVNDKSTSDLMNLFYKYLKTHSKVEALRMAQLEMINGEVGRGIVRGVGGIATSNEDQGNSQAQNTVNGSHPYFWAPFILLGDWK